MESSLVLDVELPPAVALGRLVREAREWAQLSQSALAAEVGTTQSAISRWERGHDEPRLTTLDQILRACGLRLTLVTDADDVDRAQIRQQLRLTPEERLQSAVNLGRALAGSRRVG